jgi:hypothetical protein
MWELTGSVEIESPGSVGLFGAFEERSSWLICRYSFSTIKIISIFGAGMNALDQISTSALNKSPPVVLCIILNIKKYLSIVRSFCITRYIEVYRGLWFTYYQEPFAQYQGVPGAKGRFLGFFSTLMQAAFSYFGMLTAFFSFISQCFRSQLCLSGSEV